MELDKNTDIQIQVFEERLGLIYKATTVWKDLLYVFGDIMEEQGIDAKSIVQTVESLEDEGLELITIGKQFHSGMLMNSQGKELGFVAFVKDEKYRLELYNDNFII